MAPIDNSTVPALPGGYYLQRKFYKNIGKGGALPVSCFTFSNVEASMRLSFFNASVLLKDIDPLDSMSYSSPPEDWARTNQDVDFIIPQGSYSIGGGSGCVCETLDPFVGQIMENHQQAGGVVSGDYYAHYWGDGLSAGELYPPDNWLDLDPFYDLNDPAISKVYNGTINNAETIGLVYYEDQLGTTGPVQGFPIVKTKHEFVRIFMPGPFTLRAIGSRPYEYGIFLVPLTEADDQDLDKFLNLFRMYVSVSDDLSSEITLAYSIPQAPDGYFYVIAVETRDLDPGVTIFKDNFTASPPVCKFTKVGHLTEVPTTWSINSCEVSNCGSKPIIIPSPVSDPVITSSATLGHSSHITTVVTIALIFARFFL